MTGRVDAGASFQSSIALLWTRMKVTTSISSFNVMSQTCARKDERESGEDG